MLHIQINWYKKHIHVHLTFNSHRPFSNGHQKHNPTNVIQCVGSSIKDKLLLHDLTSQHLMADWSLNKAFCRYRSSQLLLLNSLTFWRCDGSLYATAHSMWTDDPAFNLSIKNHARLTQAKQCLLNCSTGKTGKVDNYTNITQRKNYMFCRSWERLGNFNTPQQTNKILCCTSNNWTKQLLKRILTTYMWKNHCMDVFQNKCEVTAWTFSSSTSLLECFVLSFKQF